MSRYAKRRDANDLKLVRYLRALGFTVTDCTTFGEGHPDKLVRRGNKQWYVEIKNPSTAYGKKGLSASQLKWSERTGNEIIVMRNEEDVRMLK
jgi:hypothetical protein